MKSKMVWVWVWPLILSMAFLILSSVVMQTILKNNAENEQRVYLESVYQRDRNAIDTARSALHKMAKLTFQNLIFREDVVSLMAQAVHGSKAVKDEVRKKLYFKLYFNYLLLKDSHVRQLHFHLPHAISFLRFHVPKKHGDSLLSVRQSLVLVNQTHQVVSGFEEGRIFNGFRNVFPLFYKNKFVGSVEVSYGFDGVNYMMNPSKEKSTQFILKKEVTLSKVFKSEQSHYLPSELSQHYVQDKLACHELALLQGLPRDIIHRLNQQLKNHPLAFYSRHSVPIMLDDQAYTVSFMPIYNFKHQQVAYAITYRRDTMFALLSHNSGNTLIYAQSLIALLSIMIFMLLQSIFIRVRKVENIAVRDTLTGLYNRAKMEAIFKDLVKNAQTDQQALSIIFFDLDHFKAVNDQYGHLIGDDVLKDVARLVQGLIRSTDILIRWGGEEFVIILPVADEKVAIDVAEKIRAKIAATPLTREQLPVTISLGVVKVCEGDVLEAVLERADKCLYHAKETGRNKVVSGLECSRTGDVTVKEV